MIDVDFVIISYECNFWGMAALDALLESLGGAGRTVWVVHNLKTTRQIDHFKAHEWSPARPDRVRHLIAHEGVFQQVENFADFSRTWVHSSIAAHGLVLNWLIKYRLPEGRYLFVDHDCIVRRGFLAALGALADSLLGQLFVVARHDEAPKSLTAPLFYVDTAVRPFLSEFPDLGWLSNVVTTERDKLSGGREVFYTDEPFERWITRGHFDDTLHNVVRYLLSRWPELAPRLDAIRWPELDHAWHGATRHLKRAQVELLKRLMVERFRPEHFDADHPSSEILRQFLARLEENGLAAEFRERLLTPNRGQPMKPPLTPPPELDYGTAVHHFREVGLEYYEYCKTLGGLRPDGAVLDVGCGLGRLAVPLTEYLDPSGRYEGFDIVPSGIEWCRNEISSRFPNFRFTLVDVRNFTYREADGEDARSFVFPYDDGAFDLVFLRSVFTHMLPEEVDHYLGEIARVMRPGGRCLISYFLLNDTSIRLMTEPGASRTFRHRFGSTMRDFADGSGTVAYDETFILALYASHGLRLVGPVRYGSWSGRLDGLSSQDLVVATK